MMSQGGESKILVERLLEGDIVQAVEHGPLGTVTDSDRGGWTLVEWRRGTILPYRHGADRLYLRQKGANMSEPRRWTLRRRVDGTLYAMTPVEAQNMALPGAIGSHRERIDVIELTPEVVVLSPEQREALLASVRHSLNACLISRPERAVLESARSVLLGGLS